MYRGKKVIHIVAVAKNGVIGKDNDLCWQISEDLQYFKQQTLGHVCLAGRKTVESFPKPLERRVVLMVSSKPHKSVANTGVALTLDVILSAANIEIQRLHTDKIFIIGGSQLYQSTEDIVDELWITELDREFDGDTYYNKPDGFEMYESTDWLKGMCKKNHIVISFRFTKWKRV